MSNKGFVPTRVEKGAFLVALGTVMARQDLLADAALDGNSDDDLVDIMMENGLDATVAGRFLSMDHGALTEAIDGSF
jgi:hypothetical protein